MSELATRSGNSLRQIADELLEYQRVEYIHDGRLTIVATPGFTHRRITVRLVEAFNDAWAARKTQSRWEISVGDFQFDRADDPSRFFIPDLAIAYPGSDNNREFRENITLLVAITSPKSPETVENDYGIKMKQYAKADVPLYLLVDQEQGSWTLHQLIEGWPKYQVSAAGKYGESIALPHPFGFELPTNQWPPYSKDDDSA